MNYNVIAVDVGVTEPLDYVVLRKDGTEVFRTKDRIEAYTFAERMHIEKERK